MKSIKRRFNNVAKKNAGWSSYICFAEAIKEQGFGRPAVHRWFNKLVDKNDYARGEKKAIFANLDHLSSSVRTTEIEGKTAR